MKIMHFDKFYSVSLLYTEHTVGAENSNVASQQEGSGLNWTQSTKSV